MAKVFGPLLSLGASGDLAKSIQFICGHFLRKKPRRTDKPSVSQDDQRFKFKQGLMIWRGDGYLFSKYEEGELSWATKQRWKTFAKVVKTSADCSSVAGEVTGYNLWMLYWLKFGEGGWDPYPDPPGT